MTQILPRLAIAELWAGRWASSSANAREGVQLAREIGQHDLVAQQLVLLALVAALRGSEDECRSLAAESRELASARRLGIVARARALGAGAAGAGTRSGRGGAPALSGDLLHAGRFLGWRSIGSKLRFAQANRRPRAPGSTSFERWADASAATWARAAALHCRALLSDDESESERLFLAALDVHADAARPFEHARTELAYGEFLRRARRRVEARDHLRAALDGFETLGATLWAERARVELRASGQTARKRDPSTRNTLTEQELQIARFVAEGRTNREVAAQLFLSPRTIDFHLRNVYRKLGITSRTALARLDLDSESQSAPLSS